MSGPDWDHVQWALAWTLIHFLWQGCAIALALGACLSFLRDRSSQQRYLLRCSALAAIALAPPATFAHFYFQLGPGDAQLLPSVANGPAGTAAPATWLTESALSWVVALWALGATLLCLRLVGGWCQVLRLRSLSRGESLTPSWQRRFESLARDFGVQARACVVNSAAIAVPTVIGWLRPVVLLPARLFTGLSDEQIEALVAHELAHIARHDYLVNLVQSVVEALLFYHPAVWWISQGIRVEREYCCDDCAVATAENGLSYARALTALESWRGGELQLGVSTLGGSLMKRIQRLVGASPATIARPRPFHAIGTFFVVASLGASAFGFARLSEAGNAHDCKCQFHQRPVDRLPESPRLLTRHRQEEALPEASRRRGVDVVLHNERLGGIIELEGVQPGTYRILGSEPPIEFRVENSEPQERERDVEPMDEPHRTYTVPTTSRYRLEYLEPSKLRVQDHRFELRGEHQPRRYELRLHEPSEAPTAPRFDRLHTRDNEGRFELEIPHRLRSEPSSSPSSPLPSGHRLHLETRYDAVEGRLEVRPILTEFTEPKGEKPAGLGIEFVGGASLRVPLAFDSDLPRTRRTNEQ